MARSRTAFASPERIPAQEMVRVKPHMMGYPHDRRMVPTRPNRADRLGQEAALRFEGRGIGASASVRIGSDPIRHSAFRDILERSETGLQIRTVCAISAIGDCGKPEPRLICGSTSANPSSTVLLV